jgi:hypothetical protein
VPCSDVIATLVSHFFIGVTSAKHRCNASCAVIRSDPLLETKTPRTISSSVLRAHSTASRLSRNVFRRGTPSLHTHERFVGAIRGKNDGRDEAYIVAECTEIVLFDAHKDKCLTCIPREAFVFKAKFWCRLPVSNWPPDDYKSTALPNELSRRDL